MTNRAMRESEVKWIGEIPSNWPLIKLKYLCDVKTGNKDTINREAEGKYPFYVRSPHVERINSYSFDGEAILTAGDGVGAGKVFHYVDGKFDYHQRVYNLHNFQNINSKFLYYYLKNNFIREVEQGTAKSTVDSIRLPMIQNFPVVVPLREEQQNIVAFLDEKVSHINNIIEDTKKSIENLKAYKQSLITETVTKGLNPDVPMKDSGIEWITDIPAEWELVVLKRLVNIFNGREIKNEISRNETNAIPVYGTGRNAFKYTDEYLLKGKYVIFGRKGTIGEPNFINGEFWIVDTAYAATNTSHSDIRYIFYLLQIFPWDLFKTQTAIPSIVASEIIQMKVPFPDIDTQRNISEYLDNKTQKIDNLITEKQQMLKELESYKQSLIYEYVTGKKEVK